MDPLYDVIVVGGGPAGACAAWKLAQAGMTVAVLEKASLPRYKVCGGGLVGRTMRSLPIDVHHVVEQECYRARLDFVSSGLSFVTQRTIPVVSMVMRSEFDRALLSAAQAAGAALYESCVVESLSPHDDSVTVLTAKGPMRAGFVVAADGALSPVARSMKWEDGRVLIPALEYEVTVPFDRLRRFEGTARFDFDVLSRGYGWVFPKRRHLSIGILSMDRRRHGLHSVITRYVDLLGCTSPLSVERHGFVIPVRPRKGPFAKNRVLLVGDAAGFADPITGEGISYAVRSGLLAAESLIGEHLQEETVEDAYRRLVAQAILPDLRVGRILARLLYDCPRVRTGVFSRQGQRLCETVTDVMAGIRQYRDLVRPGSAFRFFTARLLSRWVGRPSQARQG
ncbi:MAG: geranylgeranyl reductase family protein [Nitrospira sp.]|nr:geranylgeranyl reductase family protein [Nitrospira sp.]MCP9476255.1 geranylgeranyl reductase family protein [Nitrospira sp.]